MAFGKQRARSSTSVCLPDAHLALTDSTSYRRTLLGAAHETTTNTLSWLLLELARNERVQQELREEIALGRAHDPAVELDSLPLLNAVIKVVQRPCSFHLRL
jgi:cytochrome P450